MSRTGLLLWPRCAARAVLLMAVAALAACATAPPPPAGEVGQSQAPESQFAGRIAVAVDGLPPQSFSASFELEGNPDAGSLILSGPLGTTVATARWGAGGATLTDSGQSRQYGSLDDLLSGVSGTPIPAAAVFDWLAGRPTQARGWLPDLSAWAQGRISAVREEPAPVARLRIVLQR